MEAWLGRLDGKDIERAVKCQANRSPFYVKTNK